MPTPPNILSERPAETTTVAAALAILVAYFLGVDDSTVVVSLAVVLGALPAAVTWVVDRVRR